MIMNMIVGCLHQETGFSAGTVTDDDEFAADFSHDGQLFSFISTRIYYDADDR